MKKTNFILVLIFSIILNSCSECPVKQSDPIFLCETRIVTMEKFNPNFQIIQGQTVLDSDYNISIYRFPDNSLSSGSFPNDSRFDGKFVIPLFSIPFTIDNQLYFANIMDTYPTNSQLSGDILVRDIDTNSKQAFLRIYGSISLFDKGILTESSQDFCNYVEANQNNIKNSFNNYTSLNKYGENQPNAIKSNFSNLPIIITNNLGEIIGSVGSPGVPTVTNEIITKLQLESAKIYAIDLVVRPGDVYTYIAANGKRFVILFTEIRQSNIYPYRKRVSMMLYPLDK